PWLHALRDVAPPPSRGRSLWPGKPRPRLPRAWRAPQPRDSFRVNHLTPKNRTSIGDGLPAAHPATAARRRRRHAGPVRGHAGAVAAARPGAGAGAAVALGRAAPRRQRLRLADARHAADAAAAVRLLRPALRAGDRRAP